MSRRNYSLLASAVAAACMLGALLAPDIGGAFGNTAVMDPPTDANDSNAFNNNTSNNTATTGAADLGQSLRDNCLLWQNELRDANTAARNANDPQLVGLFDAINKASKNTARKANALALRAAIASLPESATRDAVLKTLDDVRNFRADYGNRTYSESKAMTSAAAALFTVIHDCTAGPVSPA